MEKYKLNGAEFYSHFSQHATWLETLWQLLDSQVIKRKKARGRDFFRNVANDIIDGQVISKRCAQSILQDMSAAMIQPPSSYDGERIIPMPADMKLLAELTAGDKTQLKKRVGNMTRITSSMKSSTASASAQHVGGSTSVDAQHRVSTASVHAQHRVSAKNAIEIIDEKRVSGDLYYTQLNHTKLNPMANGLDGHEALPQVMSASHPYGEEGNERELVSAAPIDVASLDNPQKNGLGTKLDVNAALSTDNIYYLNQSDADEQRQLEHSDGMVVRLKNRTDGVSDGNLKLTLQTKADKAVYTCMLSGQDDRVFESTRTRAPHLAKLANSIVGMINNGFGEHDATHGKFQFGQLKRFSTPARALVSMRDHYAIIWQSPSQAECRVFLALGDSVISTKMAVAANYGSAKNKDLFASAGLKRKLAAQPYTDTAFDQFLSNIADLGEAA